MMTVCLDITPLIVNPPTGVQIIIKEFVKALVTQPIKLILFAVGPREAIRHLEIQWRWRGANLRFVALPARIFHQAAAGWQRVGWPPIEKFTGLIDIYHSFDWYCFSSKCPQTSTVFDLTPLLYPQWHPHDNIRVFQQRLMAISKRSRTIFALSQATKKDLSPFVKKTSIPVIYPDCAGYFKKMRVDQLATQLSRWNLEPGYLLTIGRIDPRKNFGNVLKAYQNYRDHGGQRKLVIVGYAAWESRALLQKIRRTPGIIMPGYIDNKTLPTIYQGARGFIYASLYEGFGLPILEALRMGCPVLTSSISSMPEVGGTAALYCDPDKVDSITEGIVELDRMSLTEQHKRAVVGIKESAKFSYTQSAKQMIAYWRQLQ